jgi:tetratricopeptide (TPR) repeat protein
MSAKISLALFLGVLTIAGILYASSANPQGGSTSSLADQLQAHYKLAKIVPDLNSYKVAERGTMLVIQKDGIFGVPLGSNSVDPVTYAIQKDSDLHHSNLGGSAWKFGVGHKVYISKLDLDAKHEKVSFTIVECDCSDPTKPSYYKSLVQFEFPNGYLAGAEVLQIEDVISQVLTIDNGTNDSQRQTHGAQSSSAVLKNDEIIKMVQEKFPDSLVLAQIKSSSCDFDTSTDALIKLRRAGVSDSVLQAMVDASARPNPPASGEDPPAVTTGKDNNAAPECGNYDSCMKIAQALLESSQSSRALARFQEASQLDASKGDAWAGMGSAYFQMGQYDDATAMADKALQLGSTLKISVCHAKALCGDTGTLSLSMKEISFVNKKGETELAATPSAVTSTICGILSNDTNPASYKAYCLQIRFTGKNYRFYYLPKSVQCSMNIFCPEPGLTEQRGVANYAHERLVRIAAGDFGSPPNKP